MRTLLVALLLSMNLIDVRGQQLPGFKPSGLHMEQQLVMENSPPGTRILINAPLEGFGRKDKVLLVFFALPNGNTIEQTFGRKIGAEEDWHYDIQHIGAQTRFLRKILKGQIVVTVYLESGQKSWPGWVAATHDSVRTVKSMVDQVKEVFASWNPKIVLNGHSGGGRFLFSYLDACDHIPPDVVRIAFLDSDYGYEDARYGPKILSWLQSGKDRYLSVLAYNDSVVTYNGKPLVSPTGGTWYRSKLMLKYLSSSFRFKTRNRDSLIWNSSPGNKIEVILKTNPGKKIFHTRQVELNGFIHSMLSGTRYGNRGYTYFGKRAYQEFVDDTIVMPIRRLNIPTGISPAEKGSEFMRRIASLSLADREEEIFKVLSAGNIPGFLRNTLTLKGDFADTAGRVHQVSFEVMPDYLAVGNEADFCRIPMNPFTAQRLADLYGASLVTAKLSDYIFKLADLRPSPINYVPVGNANELVSKFEAHNARIGEQLGDYSKISGKLVAGIKKDIILSNRIASHPDKVVIYGWHKPDGNPIQPVYSGHVYWYVDYSHGTRLINNQVLIDNKSYLLSEVLKDPLFFRLFSDESKPMNTTGYYRH